MTVPWVLLVLSLAGAAFGIGLASPGDVVLLAGPCVLASLYLILCRRPVASPKARSVPAPGPKRVAPVRTGRAPTPRPAHVILDGSNVMHWAGQGADLKVVKQVVNQVAAMGLSPGVIFDANVGYRVADRYLDDVDLARLLDLAADRVLVVPKGTPADEYILTAARNLGARVITNDRYRDWADRFPEVATPGFLIRGGVAKDGLWVDLPQKAAQSARS